jgi:HlyD family secretion protein
MAASGARAEDKSAAAAQVRQVDGVVAEAKAAEAETQLRSPVGGEVANVLAKQGELSPQGVAVVTVVDLNDQWLVLHVREDQLQRFAMKSRFTGRLPALDNRRPSSRCTSSACCPTLPPGAPRAAARALMRVPSK